jgi:Ca-activated chloride channel family protein
MRTRHVLLPLLALVTFVTGCASGGGSKGGQPAPSNQVNAPSTDPNTLNIVAGSEQKTVVNNIVAPWCTTKHLTCNVTYRGSVDQARLLQSGTAPYDAFWFASSVFAQLGDQAHVLQNLEPMSVTPIVFAGWKSEMQKLGFVGRDVTIDEVLKAVESKQTKTWVTNPTQSNSGATVFFGFLNYFAGNNAGQALTQAQLESADVQQGITRFVRAFEKTPPSTGTLMDDCIANDTQCRTMFTYEDLVMERNKDLVAQGHEPLYVVYPQGALAISDAPLGFLPHGDNPKKLANFQALQSYLLDPATQQQLLQYGRRPADITGLALTNAPKDVFNPDWGIRTTIKDQQLVYPAGPVIDSALSNYQLNFRSPADAVFCIDGSGSMDGNGGWSGVKSAADLLFNPDKAKQYFLQVNPGDRTTVFIFNDGNKGGPWTVSGDNPTQLLDLRDKILSKNAGGGTAIYDCLGRAADYFNANPSDNRKRLVILMTDGQNTDGGTDGLDKIAGLHIPVVAVAFGSGADGGALKKIASQTGGAFIQSNDLVKSLRDATSYK